VELLIRIEIKLNDSYFSNQAQYDLTHKIFGDVVFYEHRMERTFVNNMEKDNVLNDLLASFKKDSLPYLSHADFARRFCLSKYSDIVKNPYKYQRPS
jgi:hypothetical protein